MSILLSFCKIIKLSSTQVIYSISGDYSATGNNVKTVSLDGETLMNESEYESVRNEVDDILNKNFKLK